MAKRNTAATDRSQVAKAGTKGVEQSVAAPRPSRGAVDAPGKRHRKPPPQERIDTRMGEPVGKKMGQKGAKGRIRGARG